MPPPLRPAIVTIDGPAASGKSTIGRSLADRLDFLFFDTGIMYRAVTWAALERNVEVTSEERLGALAERIEIDIRTPQNGEADGRQSTVLVDGEDVTWRLRSPAVEQNVSAVSAHARVRAALSKHQRRIGLRYGGGDQERAGIVMVGRDIGTVVLPEAPLKIFLDASAEARARRRHAELVERGKALPYEQVLAEIVARDAQDSSRAVSPLRPASDAVVVDTTALTPDQVVERILGELRARFAVPS